MAKLEPEQEHPRECCSADPRISRHFDRQMREKALKGQLPEMVDVSRALLGMLDDVASARPTLLELGCGSGALTVELLRLGATQADGVDLSAESLALARRRAEEADVADRAVFLHGDGAEVPLAQHDWVVLDRVICCYAHVGRLLANAMPAARTRFAFSVPHDRGWRGIVTRTIGVLERITSSLRGGPCPGYVHDISMIERQLAGAGFRRLRQATVGLWYTAVFER